MVSKIVWSWLSIRLMFIDIFIVRKKRFRRMLWNGLILVFNWCWYLELVKSILVRKVFNVIDKLIYCIRSVIFNIIRRFVVVKILLLLESVIIWKIGCIKKCLIKIMFLIVIMIWIKGYN